MGRARGGDWGGESQGRGPGWGEPGEGTGVGRARGGDRGGESQGRGPGWGEPGEGTDVGRTRESQAKGKHEGTEMAGRSTRTDGQQKSPSPPGRPARSLVDECVFQTCVTLLTVEFWLVSVLARAALNMLMSTADIHTHKCCECREVSAAVTCVARVGW